MARGHNHPLRSTLAGHGPRRSYEHAIDDAARAAALERLWAFLADYYDPLTAENERYWLESRGDEVERRQALTRRAEDLSRILGYAYGSCAPGGHARLVVMCDACQGALLPRIAETGYGPRGAMYHRHCLPARAGHDYGFVRWEDDPEAFFVRAFAELDAGVERPAALPAPRARRP